MEWKNIFCLIILVQIEENHVSGVQNVIVCGDATLTITCSENLVLQILEGVWGRTTVGLLPCNHRLLQEDQVYTCHLDILTTLRGICDDKESCLLQKLSSFVDPCKNVFKYLNVTYTCITATADFASGSQNYATLTPDTTSSTLNLTFSGSSPSSVTATIHTGLTSGDVDLHKSVITDKVTFTSTDFTANSLVYGVYGVLLKFEGNTYGDVSSAVIYETPITGFQVTVPPIVPANENVIFDVTFTQASNIEIEWHWDISNKSTEIYDVEGSVTSIVQNHTFVDTGQYNITVVAGNPLGRAYQHVLFVVQHNVNGFQATVDSGPYDTGELTSLIIGLSSTALDPMGALTINVTYGDGTAFSINSISETTKTQMMTSGQTIQDDHTYTSQGNFSGVVVVMSEISSQKFPFERFIWDNISALSIDVPSSAGVGDTIPIAFLNPPANGFNYIISTGDGSPQIESDPSFLYSSYSDPGLSYTYANAGTYTIDMLAWNPFYSVSCNFTIVLQYPIRDLTIRPELTSPSIMYPIQKGTVPFEIEMTGNFSDPTDVICEFDYGDANATEPTDPGGMTAITYGVPVLLPYTYTVPGYYNVNFTCYNVISSAELLTEVEIIDATPDMFSLSYPAVTGMNMTSIPPTNENDDPTFLYDPKTVKFTVELLRCHVFPDNIDIELDFGDGAPPKSLFNVQFGQTIDHTFLTRETFTITMVVSNNVNGTIPAESSHSIKMGVADLTVPITSGVIGLTQFTFTASGLGTGSTYELTYGPELTYTYTGTTATKTHIYPEFERFFPYMKAYNATFYETVYLTRPVTAELALSGVNISIPSKVDLPPGDFVVNVTITPPKAFPFINCTFQMGDLIDRKTYWMYQNLTEASPFTFPYRYQVLGNLTALINCSNSVSNVLSNTTVNVWNECFQPTGIFDRDYSNDSNPLVIYTSYDTDLGSRMGVYCTDQAVDYTWKLYTIDDNGTYGVPYPYTPVVQPTGIIRFAKGTVEENTYRVTLNVTLNRTWVHEPTFIKMVKPPPYSYIVGGSMVSIKLSKFSYTFDALTGSYDVMHGYGANANLDFVWSCRLFPTSAMDVLKSSYDSAVLAGTLESQQDCMPSLERVDNETASQLWLNLTIEAGYAVTVMVILDDLNSTYTQLLQARQGAAPDVRIECQYNCETKYAIRLKSLFKAVCYDCEPGEINFINFGWRLQIGGTYVSDAGFLTMSATGSITAPEIALQADIFGENIEANLWLSASGGWGRTADVTLSGYSFRTNILPYGGSCNVNPTVGKAATTPFNIYCSGYLDEGNNLYKDSYADSVARNPLKFQYFAIDKDENGDIISEAVIYSGAEMSATELKLGLGDPDMGYKVTLMVKIIDKYGDFVTSEMEATVEPDSNLQPTSGNDTGSVNNLFSVFDQAYAVTKHGGNTMSVIRLVSSTASMYGHVTVTDAEETKTNVSTNPFLDPRFDSATDTSAQSLLKEKNKQLLTIVKESIPASTNPAPLLAGDCQTAATAVKQVLTNTDVVSKEVSMEGFDSSLSLITNVKRTSQTVPFPMDEFDNVMYSTSAVIGSVDANLEYFFATGDENLETEITPQSIREELTNVYATYRKDLYDEEVGSDENFELLVQKVYNQRTVKRSKVSERVEVSRQKSSSMFDTIDTALNLTGDLMQYGEAPVVIKKKNVHLSVEKTSIDNFIAQNKVERNNVSIAMGNLTKTNSSQAAVQLQVSVFDKSPVPHATGNEKISSKCVTISTTNHDKQTIDFEKEVKIPNPGVVTTHRHETVLDVEDPDLMMYFRFEVKDNDDALINYISYEEEYPDMDVLYTAYIRCGDYPSSTEFSYTYDVTLDDLDDRGLKIFAPSGTLKAGTCFLGLQPKQYIATDSTLDGPVRRKRSTNTSSSSTGPADPMDANFTIASASTGCKSYNKETSTWESNGCVVLPFSTFNETVCRCPSNTRMIALTFFASPNMIDFGKVWGQFALENAAVYGTLTGLLILFIILAVYLRRKDKADSIKWSLRFLCDCSKTDQYFYIISVHTGLRPGSGTESNVSFVMAGENGDTGVRGLSDGIEQGFEKGCVRNFVMSTDVILGPLTYFRLWHDNSGDGDQSSWYLHKIIVDDPQTNTRYVFLCDKWLSLDFDDGMIERILPVLDTSNMDIESMFFQRSRSGFTENHLWLSLFVRPTRSIFSRVERLGCGFTLLLLTMITNAMFFRSADEETVSADTVQIGFFRLSLTNLYIAFISILITTPPIFFASFVFRNVEPNKQSNKQNCVACCMKNRRTNKNNTNKASDDDFLVFRKQKFPHWVTYVAWTVLFLASVASAFFLLLYSMQWGKDKSEEWLSTFILSFLESFIFVDPVKVLFIAFLLTILFRKHVDDETTLINMRKLREAAQKNCLGNSNLYWKFRTQVLSKCMPPPQDELNEQRKRRKQEMKATAVFREVILYTIFAIIVYLISYINRDNRSFRFKTNVDNTIYTSTKYDYGFEKINSAETFMNWTTALLVPAFYPVQEYNGKSLRLQDKFYIGDLANVRLGVVRLRQVRMPWAKCEYWKLTPHRFCLTDFQTDLEETDEFCPSWKPKSGTCSSGSLTFDAYKHRSASELHGIPIAGTYDVYTGGGYVQDLPNNRDDINAILAELKELYWIDRRTRAVFVEFTLYNPNTNLIAYSTFATEFAETGTVVHHATTKCFRPSLITDATGALSILLYFIYIVTLIIATVKIIGKLKKHRLSFFKVIWNVVDFFTTTLSYAAIGIWIVKYIATKDALNRYYNDTTVFINFSQIVVWDDVFNCIIAGVVFTATLRILKALGYNKRCAELVTVIRYAAKELISFLVIFTIAFFGFAILGNLLFGSYLYEYKNLLIALGSLSNTLIGRNSLDKLISAAGAMLAQFYFFCYVLFIIFILLTMFAAILNQSISSVREEYKKEESPVGILTLIAGAGKDLLGLVGIRMRTTNKRNIRKYQHTAKISKDALIDTGNVLHLLRDTFGNVEEREKLARDNLLRPPDEINDKDKQFLIRAPSTLSRARTADDIDLRISATPSRQESLYNTYL